MKAKNKSKQFALMPGTGNPGSSYMISNYFWLCFSVWLIEQ